MVLVNFQVEASERASGARQRGGVWSEGGEGSFRHELAHEFHQRPDMSFATKKCSNWSIFACRIFQTDDYMEGSQQMQTKP
jgi:hypothetical protein